MPSHRIPKVHAGQALSARHFNEIVDAVNSLLSIGGAGTVTVSHGPAGLIIKASEIHTKFGQLDGPLEYASGALGGSAVCSIYSDNRVTDTGENITVYCSKLAPGDVIAGGSWVDIDIINGNWNVIGVRCPVA